MTTFLARRLVSLVPVLFGVTVVIFIALHLAPGNPALLLTGPQATPEQVAQINTELGLDKPWPVQYATWMEHILRGDFGESISYHQDVAGLLGPRLVNTLILAVAALVLATVFGVAAGILAALRPAGWIDHGLNVLAFVGLAAPVFWLGLMLALLFGVMLRWFPVSGITSAGGETTIADVAYHVVLPAVALAIAPAVVISQVTRITVLAEVDQLYFLVARAKGLTKTRALLVHAFRNSWLPILTTLGLNANAVVGGGVLVENIYSWPGLGQLLLVAIQRRDYPVVLGASLVLAVIFVAINALVDLLYPLVDPRVNVRG